MSSSDLGEHAAVLRCLLAETDLTLAVDGYPSGIARQEGPATLALTPAEVRRGTAAEGTEEGRAAGECDPR